jgi:hypothetical protein
MLINIAFMMLMCQPKLTIDVAPCFVLRANRSLVGILHNNGLRHSALLKHNIGFSVTILLDTNNGLLLHD